MADTSLSPRPRPSPAHSERCPLSRTSKRGRPALVHNLRSGAAVALPEVSGEPSRDGHAESGHAVEHLAADPGLVKQRANQRGVALLGRGQGRSEYLAGVRIDGQVQLAPGPPIAAAMLGHPPFTGAENLQAGAV